MKHTLKISAMMALIALGAWSCGSNNSSTKGEETEGETFSAIKSELPMLNDIVKAESNINTFLVVLDSARMSWVLRGERDAYILFAPTDEAFAALGASTVNELLQPENREQLSKIVRNHIVKGRVPYEFMEGGMQAQSESNKLLIFEKLEDGTRTVNGARIIKADIEGSNGIVHIIDKVIQ
jgi:uncharacterized surface protein with fasciclin (FAS1) repeats